MAVQEKPTIKLTFDGLILLHFAEDKTHCEAIVLRVKEHGSAKEHEFKITIKGHPEIKELSEEIQNGDLLFKVLDAKEKVSLDLPRSFDRAVGGAFDRDFRWVANLEGSDFHDRKLHPRHHALTQGKAQTHHGVEKTQSIVVNQGKFYTARKHKVVKVAPGSREGEEVYVADVVGCDVELREGQVAILEYGPKDNRECIEFRGGQGKHYKIQVSNNRLPAAESDARPRPGDFRHYYGVFGIGEKEEFQIWSTSEYREARKGAINSTSLGAAAASASKQYPCDPATCGC
jgi:hypothetical protein